MVHEMGYGCESSYRLGYVAQCLRWHLFMDLHSNPQQFGEVLNVYIVWRFFSAVDNPVLSRSFSGRTAIGDLKFYQEFHIRGTPLKWLRSKIQISSLLWKCWVASLLHRRLVYVENHLYVDNLAIVTAIIDEIASSHMSCLISVPSTAC